MEQVTRWDIVLVIIGLLTFAGFFTKPLITLVKTLTRLVTVVDALEKHCAKNEDTNTADHKEFRDKFEENGTVLAEHGTMLQAHDIVIKEVLSNHTQ